MKFGPTRLRWRASMVVFLAAVWLPQLALPCLAGAGGPRGCHGFSGRALARDSAQAGAGVSRARHHCGSKPGSSPNCCQVVGKCKPGALASTPGAEPPALVSVMLPIPGVVRSHAEHAQPRLVRFAHGPPTYLRLATLLI